MRYRLTDKGYENYMHCHYLDKNMSCKTYTGFKVCACLVREISLHSRLTEQDDQYLEIIYSPAAHRGRWLPMGWTYWPKSMRPLGPTVLMLQTCTNERTNGWKARKYIRKRQEIHKNNLLQWEYWWCMVRIHSFLLKTTYRDKHQVIYMQWGFQETSPQYIIWDSALSN